MDQSEISLDVVMARRFEIDKQMTVITNRHKAELAPLAEELKLCETYLRTKMLAGNMQQLKITGVGQAYFTTKTRSSVNDWDALLAHIREQNLWQLLTKAVGKEAVKEYLDERQELPPGVKFEQYKDLSWSRGG